MKKTRLDVILVEKGIFSSREKAKRNIMAGRVMVDGKLVDKPGTKVAKDAKINVKEDENPFVSRGGLKLSKALKVFNVDTKGKTAVDIGASTGGFTDCLLKSGVTKVYSVDVGYGQLDWKLRNDPRVIVLERKNARYLKPRDLGEKCSLATIDVSFISITKILNPLKQVLIENSDIIALVKPQFEAGPDRVGKKGVVKDKRVHTEVLKEIVMWTLENGFKFLDLTYSPIKGASGNIEFLAHWKLNSEYDAEIDDEIMNKIKKIVEEAHSKL